MLQYLKKFLEIKEKNQAFRQFYYNIIEKQIWLIDDYRIDLLTLTPEERYRKLLVKENNLLQHVYRYSEFKKKSYLNKMSIEDAKKYKHEHNEQFEETIRVSNVYNRLIAFDSHLQHAAQDFFGKGEESRLTLVFFVNKLFTNNTPISRVRRITS